VSRTTAHAGEKVDRQALILEAVLSLLSRRGISGVSMRAVSREANVALGLVHYYYEDKTSLIAAALRRVEEQDIAIVEPDPMLPPEERVRAALRRVADPEFLTTEYLSLRLQLWALGQAHEAFAHINTAAQKRYGASLAALIRTARPGLSRAECDKRAADIDILQNGMWLTALLGLDRASIRRTVARSEEIALALVDVGEEIAERGASLSALSAPGA
jgi:TetR/AcrR family transcriptional regulator, cholesterol catabolism regulator